MEVPYSRILWDLNNLTYYEYPDFMHLRHITFTASDVDKVESHLEFILGTTADRQQKSYISVLILISIYNFDSSYDASSIMFEIYRIVIEDYKGNHALEQWLLCELFSNNGDLSRFVREYNRFKLTHPNILD